MINLNEYFYFLNFSPTTLLDEMYYESSIDKNYYLSPAGVTRSDVGKFVRENLKKIINVEFHDCGYLKTMPKQMYKPHIDIFRIAALNMPLFDNIREFRSFVIANNNFHNIEYKRNFFTLLNVEKMHGSFNNHTQEQRIILSIGFKHTSYSKLLELYNCNRLLNYDV